MRVKLKFSKNTQPVPIENYSILNSYVHKSLGNNNPYHDKHGNYSMSSMQGGKLIPGTSFLNFEDGMYVVISAIESDYSFLENLIKGVTDNPKFGYGMVFNDVEFMMENFYEPHTDFISISPILLKEILERNKYRYVTFKDNDFIKILTERTKNRLLKINPSLDMTGFRIELPEAASSKVKRVLVKNVMNVTSQCPIRVYGNKKVIELLYNVGIGQSTNSGFGCLITAESYSKYRTVRKEKMVAEMEM